MAKYGPKPRSLEERFLEKIDYNGPVFGDRGPCWLWTAGRTTAGYGQIGAGGQFGHHILAHRVAFELFKRPLADGEVIDHLCRRPACVNPDHLEAVTHKVNLNRGMHPNHVAAMAGTCTRGHALTPDNTRIRVEKDRTRRVCRLCDNARRMRSSVKLCEGCQRVISGVYSGLCWRCHRRREFHG